MARIRSRDTSPELFVRSKLHRAGFRFSLAARRLPGRPDIVLRKYTVVVFVHGCFWHNHDCRRGKPPSSNTDFWKAKISANVERDRRVTAACKTAGWHVVVIWECELEKQTQQLIKRLQLARAKANK